MPKSRVDFLPSPLLNLPGHFIFILLFLLALFIRFPFFFRDYIDLDESTFILLGQSWVDGHLPYTELWDLKPPMVFLFFAGVIFLFGKSFIAIRLAGVLVISISAFVIYLIGKHIHSKQTGILAAFFYVLLSSLFGSLQGVMSEHLSMLFFIPAIFLLLQNTSLSKVFLSGLLFGLALMTKLNLSYAVLLVFFGFFAISWEKQRRSLLLLMTAAFFAGVLLPTVLFYLLYENADQGMVFIDSVFNASLAYGAIPLADRLDSLPFIILILGALITFFLWLKKNPKIVERRYFLVLGCAIIGILFSFFQVGKINGHYLIQIHPFLALLLSIALAHLLRVRRKWLRAFIVFLLMLLPMESYLEYRAIAKNYYEKNTLYNGEGIEVPEYLKNNNLDKKRVLFLEFHIGYWLLNKQPLTKATTHPSNMMRDQLFPYLSNFRKTSLAELQFILLEKKPEIIVTKGAGIPFNADHKEEVYAYFEEYLAQHYRLIKQIGKATIYEKLH